MTNRLITSQCEDDLIDGFTKELLRQAIESVTTKGVFNLVLSDSSSLDSVYARLMYDPDMRAIPWNEIHLWFIRNREDSLVIHSGIPEENVHDGKIDQEIDCCILSCDDISDVCTELRNSCNSFLIFSYNTTPPKWSHYGVAHWFC
ncbi:MAG: hypothetical protein QF718_00770 [Phycisphaerales bacterium]|jgi:hypothetical protein|nr:hypothetical protein [Phycisphaerales bacterium]